MYALNLWKIRSSQVNSTSNEIRYICTQKWAQKSEQYKQVASRKSALPKYYIAHVVNSGDMSNQDQTLAHVIDHFTSTITCNWTPLEELVTNTINMWPIMVGYQTLAHFISHPRFSSQRAESTNYHTLGQDLILAPEILERHSRFRQFIKDNVDFGAGP